MLPVASDNPNAADFFTAFAAVMGYESYRTAEGTWFINALCQNIRKYAFDDSKHLGDICVRVNQVRPGQ